MFELVAVDAILATNYYLELGLFPQSPKGAMVLGCVATVVIALYLNLGARK